MDLPSDLHWIQMITCDEFGIVNIQKDFEENLVDLDDISALTSYSQITEEFGMSYPFPYVPSYQVLVGAISCQPPVAAHCHQEQSGTSYHLEADGRYSYENPPPAHNNQQYSPRNPAIDVGALSRSQHVDLSTLQIVSRSNNISQIVNSQSILGESSKQDNVGQLLTEKSKLKVPVGNSSATLSVVQNSSVRIHNCSICQKQFTRRDTLNKHFQTFSHQMNVQMSEGAPSSPALAGSRRPRCKICDRSFSTNGYLIQHNNVHHRGEKPFKCKTCGKRFNTKEYLDAHAEKHYDSEKYLKCQYCPKTFNYTYDLKRHRSLHTGEGLLTCSCGKRFARRDHMVRHVLRYSCK